MRVAERRTPSSARRGVEPRLIGAVGGRRRPRPSSGYATCCMPDEVKPSSALRVSAIFLGTIVALLFLWTTRSIFVTAFVALLFAVSIMPIVDRLQRFRIPRGHAHNAYLQAAAQAGIVGLAAYLLRRSGWREGSKLLTRAEDDERRLARWAARRERWLVDWPMRGEARR